MKHWLSDLSVGIKLYLPLAVTVLGFGVLGLYALYGLNEVKVGGPDYNRIVQDKDLIADILPPPMYILEAYLNTWELQSALQTQQSSEVMAALIAKAQALRQDYRTRLAYWTNTLPEDQLKETLVKLSAQSANEFFDVRDQEFIPAIQAGDLNRAQIVLRNTLTPLYEAHRKFIDQVVAQATAREQTAEQQAASLIQTILIVLLILGLVTWGGSLAVSMAINQGVTGPLTRVTQAVRSVARGEVDQTLDFVSKDEVGQLAAAFRELVAYQSRMAAAAERLAEGDLTAAVTPLSEKDLLGQAFVRMTANLGRSIGAVTRNAASLAASGLSLNDSTRQSRAATQQMAGTLQHIAAGSQQQTASVARTAAAMDALRQATTAVSQGVQTQGADVDQANNLVQELNLLIEHVAAAAAGSQASVAEAVTIAQAGAQTVAANQRGMQAIQQTVGSSAAKVKEMGERSARIGLIVETIDDIARQTNLLALNAAIEAARAGQQGRGFAVVAEEVRKLAVNAATATQEIAGLVREIQRTVAEAVAAMEAGALDVEHGAAQAAESGAALSRILGAIDSFAKQIGEIPATTQIMQASAEELVTAMQRVSQVVEANTSAAETMAHGVQSVTGAITEIAQVTQANSQAAQEVAVTAQQLGQQVEAAAQAAEALAEMSQVFEGVAGQFRLDTTATAGPLLVWDEALSTGIAEVDAQHQALIAKVNELSEAMARGQGGAEVEELLDFLGQYAQKHFGFEEHCMEAYRCPAAGRNRQAHAQFIEKFGAFRQQVRASGPSAALTGQMLQELSQWLLNHIGKVDRQLRPCVTPKAAARVKARG